MRHLLLAAVVGAISLSQAAAQEIDYSQLKLAHTLKGHSASISALAVSPDGKVLATASFDKTLRLWDLSTGKLKRSPPSHFATVRALCFSPDGAILASAGGDKTIKLWDVAEAKEIANLAGRSKSRALTFSPDGKTLASASHDKLITLWNIPEAKKLMEIETGHRTWVRQILFSPDGKIMASNGYYDVKAWNESGKEIGAIKGRVSAMKFSADGKTLTSAISNKVTRWKVASQHEPRSIKGESHASYKQLGAIMSPDGKTLASIDQDLAGVDLGRALVPFGKKRCRLILMDIESGNERTIVETQGSQNWFAPRTFSPNGAALVLWNRNDEAISVVAAADGKQLIQLTSPDGNRFKSGFTPPLLFAPDGKMLITTHGPLIALWVAP